MRLKNIKFAYLPLAIIFQSQVFGQVENYNDANNSSENINSPSPNPLGEATGEGEANFPVRPRRTKRYRHTPDSLENAPSRDNTIVPGSDTSNEADPVSSMATETPDANAAVNDVTPDLKLGLNYLARHNYPKAIAEFDKVIKYDSSSYEAINLKGVCYLRQGDLDSAYTAFKQCLAIKPDFLDCIDNIASVLARQNDYSQALGYFLQELKLVSKPDANLLVNIADCYLALNNDNKALEYCKMACAKNSPGGFNLLGWIYFKHGDYDKALSNINHAIELRPNYALAYYHLGEIQRSLNDKERALEAYKNSLKYETNPRYLFDTKQTIAQLQASLGVSPSLASGNMTATGQNPDSNAGPIDSKATNVKPDVKEAIALNNMAYGYFQQKNYTLALDIFEQALTKADLITVNCNMATVYLAMKDYKSAKKYYTKAIDLAKRNKKICPLANLGLGQVYYSTNNEAAAAEAFKLAIAQGGDNTESVAYYNLALIYAKQSNLDMASQYLAKYKSLCPEDKTGIDLVSNKILNQRIINKETHK